MPGIQLKQAAPLPIKGHCELGGAIFNLIDLYKGKCKITESEDGTWQKKIALSIRALESWNVICLYWVCSVTFSRYWAKNSFLSILCWTSSSNPMLIYCPSWTETHHNRWYIFSCEDAQWILTAANGHYPSRTRKGKLLESQILWILQSRCQHLLAAVLSPFLHSNLSRMVRQGNVKLQNGPLRTEKRHFLPFVGFFLYHTLFGFEPV